MTKNPRNALQFITKKEAQDYARNLPGFGPSDVIRESVMGFYVWTIQDHHGNMVARTDYFSEPKQ